MCQAEVILEGREEEVKQKGNIFIPLMQNQPTEMALYTKTIQVDAIWIAKKLFSSHPLPE